MKKTFNFGVDKEIIQDEVTPKVRLFKRSSFIGCYAIFNLRAMARSNRCIFRICSNDVKLRPVPVDNV